MGTLSLSTALILTALFALPMVIWPNGPDGGTASSRRPKMRASKREARYFYVGVTMIAVPCVIGCLLGWLI